MTAFVFLGQELAKQGWRRLERFERQYCEVTEGRTRIVKVPYENAGNLRRRLEQQRKVVQAGALMPETLLVALVSQFDAYLGLLLRAIYFRKPELLASSEKTVTFADASRFESLDQLKEYLLEKEIETLLRESHEEQFRQIENRFKLSTLRAFESWPRFIELTERRNLFVHTAGVASSQYMVVCRRVGATIEDGVKEGIKLGVSKPYFEQSYRCVYETGVKLAQTLWRKVFPNESRVADTNLNQLCFDLIDSGNHDLAIELLRFGLDQKQKGRDEVMALMLRVNLAQAYKWTGRRDKCSAVLNEVDWSAKADQFKLAHAVLEERWADSVTLMRRMGRHGDIEPESYRHWPLFRQFRKQTEFVAAYREIFDEDFEGAAAKDSVVDIEEEGEQGGGDQTFFRTEYHFEARPRPDSTR